MYKQNVALIGCGQIGALYDLEKDDICLSHAKGCYLSKNCNLSVVVDKDLETARKVAIKYDTKYLDDYKKINLEKIDIVTIAVPTKYHFEVLEYLYVNSFKGIIVLEKPVVETSEQLKLLKTFKKAFLNNIKVNYIRRYDSVYLKIIENLKNNKYNQIKTIQINFFGTFEHNGVHALNILNYIFNDKPIVSFYDEKIIVLKYKSTTVVFNKLDTKFLNFDIVFFTNTHKIVFDELGYRVSIFKEKLSDKFDFVNELDLIYKENILNGYIVNLYNKINSVEDKFPDIYQGIYDLELIKEITNACDNTC